MMDLLTAFRTAKLPPSARGTERFLWFSKPVLEHIAAQHGEHRLSGRAKLGDRGRAIQHQFLEKALVETISKQLKTDPEMRRGEGSRVPPDLLIRHVASTFILVLNWWIEHRFALDPRQIDVIFRTLVAPIVPTN